MGDVIQWTSSDRWPLAVGLLLTAAALLWARARDWGQMLLPVTVVLLLAMATLGPAVRRLDAPGKPRLIVLVDGSASMAVVETEATPAERVAMARAQGVWPAEFGSTLADRAGPHLVKLAEIAERIGTLSRERDYQRLLRTSDTASGEAAVWIEAWNAAAVRIEKLVPTARAPRLRALSDARARGDLLSGLREAVAAASEREDAARYESDGAARAIAEGVGGQSRYEQATRLAERLAERCSEDFDISMYDFAAALRKGGSGLAPPAEASVLRDAVQEAILAGSNANVAAVVLFSDGIDTGPANAPRGAILGEAPVFAVGVAARRSRDVSLSHLALPAAVYAGQDTLLSLDVVRRGSAGPLRLVVSVDGQAAADVWRSADVGRSRLELPFRVPVNASSACVVRVELRTDASEAISINNAVEGRCRVRPGKLRLRLIASTSTSDVSLLAETVRRWPWVALADAGDADVILLAGTAAGDLPAAKWTELRSLVGRGATAVWLAGDDAAVRSITRSPLSSWLACYRRSDPATWQILPGGAGNVRLVAAAFDTVDPLSSVLAHHPIGSQARLFRYLLLPPLLDGAETLFRDELTAAPLIVSRPFGRGRVVGVGLDELWRLSSGDDGVELFWRRLLQGVAPIPPDAVGSASAIEPITVAPGELIRLRRVTDGLQPATTRLLRDDDPTATYEIALSPSGYAAARLSEPGGYGVLGDAAACVTVVAPPSEELVDIQGRPWVIEELAGATGGRVVPLSSFDSLPRSLPIPSAEPRPRLRRLLGGWPAFWTIGGLLCLHWSIRKLRGLP